MPTLLPSISLVGAVVGQQFKVDLTNYVRFDPATYRVGSLPQPAHLEIFNESGCGVTASMVASGDSFYVPAGKWGSVAIAPNDSQCILTVTYILPNPPVSTLTPVYYDPSEEVPSNYTLGNSPIGIGGAVNVSTVQTLSNEGNAANTLVIDIGDTAFAQLYTIFTDGHGIWQVDASGTKHQVLKVNTTSNFLQLGQNGDTIEVLGSELIDQTLTVTSTLTSNGNLKVNSILDNVTGATQITLATAGISILNAIQNAITMASTLTVNGGLPSVTALHGVNCTTPGDTYFLASNGATVLSIDAANKNLNMNSPNIGGAGSLNLQVGGANAMSIDATQTCSFAHSINLVVGSLGQLKNFSGTGSGTVATGVTNPTSIAFDSCTVSGSSQTFGGTIASSSVVTAGAGLAWAGTAWHT